MQRLNLQIIKSAKSVKIKKLEEAMQEVVLGNRKGGVFDCPFCHYQSKKNKGSAIIFQDKGKDIFFCFSCRKWRGM